MFHCFSSQSVKLSKPNPGKVIHLLPLDNNTIIALDDNNSIIQYRLASGAIITHILLHFKPRKIVAINSDSILALSPQDRRLYQIQLSQQKISIVYSFEVGHHYNTHHVNLREKEYFSTMQMSSFNRAEACFLRQERSEERKVRLHFFLKEHSSKEVVSWKYVSQEESSNGTLVDKYDEVSKVVFWKQQVQTNSEFQFSTFDFVSKEKVDSQLQSQSFTNFSIVRAIRATSDGFCVCLNHKNPEILLFSSAPQPQSKLIKTHLLWIANLASFSLNFSLSEEPSSGRLQMRTITGDLLDKVEAINDEICASKSGELILDYSKERKDCGYLGLRAIRVHRKEKLMLHLMENSGGRKLSSGFMGEVLSLLQ